MPKSQNTRQTSPERSREIKIGPAHCWVISWSKDERYPFTKNFLHVLPYRWGPSRVLDYLLGIYHNSALQIFERRSWLNSKPRHGIVIEERGPRITVGHYPYLSAWLVRDFRSVYKLETKVEIVTFTLPPGAHFNRETGYVETEGPSREFSLEFKH